MPSANGVGAVHIDNLKGKVPIVFMALIVNS